MANLYPALITLIMFYTQSIMFELFLFKNTCSNYHYEPRYTLP